MTTEEFDKRLEAKIAACSAEYLLTIPGVYELLAEEFNNVILHDAEREEEE